MTIQVAGGTLHWGVREAEAAGERPTQSAYYSHSYYRVPVSGPVSLSAIRSALADRYRTSLTGWSVGGYSTPSSVVDNGDGTVTVEMIYHHGD